MSPVLFVVFMSTISSLSSGEKNVWFGCEIFEFYFSVADDVVLSASLDLVLTILIFSSSEPEKGGPLPPGFG